MKIGFYGATGSWDFGDYAMMIHNIQSIWKIDNNTEFYIITPNKYITLQVLVDNLVNLDNIKKIHLVSEPFLKQSFKKMVMYKALKKMKNRYNINKHLYQKLCSGDYSVLTSEFKEAISMIDILLFNGGGYIQHSWGESNYSFMASIKYASDCKKKVFFLSNSIGPLFQYSKDFNNILPLINKIMIRDGHNYTEKLLLAAGYNNYENGPDDLTFVNQSYSCKSDFKNYVVIEIMSWINRAKRGEKYVLEEMAKFIRFIISKKKDVVLVTFDICDSAAEKYIEYLYNSIDAKECIHKLIHPSSMYDIFGLYRNCDFSVSFKYHPVILALGSNVPFIGVICDNDGYYEGKMYGACENMEINSKDYIIHIDSISSDILIEMYDKNISDNPVNDLVLKDLKNRRDNYLSYLISGDCLNG